MPEKVVRHHRRPRSRGGSDHTSNISIVRKKDHVAYHRLFGNMLPDEVAAMLTDTWIDREYYLVAVPYKKNRPKKRRKRRYCTDCQCEVLQHIPLKGEKDE